MFKNNRFKKKPRCSASLVGPMFIALGIGVFLAYIIPNYILIALFGIALIAIGIKFICK